MNWIEIGIYLLVAIGLIKLVSLNDNSLPPKDKPPPEDPPTYRMAA